MKKSEIINRIIELQKSKPEIFVKIAEENELKKLTISELNMIYNVSYLAN